MSFGIRVIWICLYAQRTFAEINKTYIIWKTKHTRLDDNCSNTLQGCNELTSLRVQWHMTVNAPIVKQSMTWKGFFCELMYRRFLISIWKGISHAGWDNSEKVQWRSCTVLPKTLVASWHSLSPWHGDDFLLILRVFADTTVNKVRNCCSAVLFHIHNNKIFRIQAVELYGSIPYVKYSIIFKVEHFKKTDEILFEPCIKHALYWTDTSQG